jgi:hypothetical protein
MGAASASEAQPDARPRRAHGRARLDAGWIITKSSTTDRDHRGADTLIGVGDTAGF